MYEQVRPKNSSTARTFIMMSAKNAWCIDIFSITSVAVFTSRPRLVQSSTISCFSFQCSSESPSSHARVPGDNTASNCSHNKVTTKNFVQQLLTHRSDVVRESQPRINPKPAAETRTKRPPWARVRNRGREAHSVHAALVPATAYTPYPTKQARDRQPCAAP